jgi:hypothetical protein
MGHYSGYMELWKIYTLFLVFFPVIDHLKDLLEFYFPTFFWTFSVNPVISLKFFGLIEAYNFLVPNNLTLVVKSHVF